MLKRFVLIGIIMMFIVACTPADTEEDVSAEVEQTTAEEIAPTEQAIAVQPTEIVVNEPTIEPTEAEVVVQPTEVEPTTIPPTTIPPTDTPPTQETVVYNAPEWTTISLTNVATGENFTLADFAGKTVFIEPMATWCTNCYAQQGRVAQAMAQLDSDDYVFISMSVGEQVSADVLSEYANRNGFPQIFVIGTPEIVTSLVDQFGFTVTNPPATPHIIIAPDGTVQDLSTGRIDSSELAEELTAIHNG